MENLVLVSVVRTLASLCREAALADVRQDAAHRFRLLFDDGARTRTVLVSLLPDLPWIGRPAAPPLGRHPLTPFGGTVRKALAGARVTGVSQPPAERMVRFAFGDGRALVAELRPRAANLVLLDPDGTVRATFRRSRTRRLQPGEAWCCPDPPAGRPEPATAPEEGVRTALSDGADAGEPLARSLVRRLFGVGPDAATLVTAEATASRDDPAAVLRRRIDALAAGELAAVADVPEDAIVASEEGRLAADGCRLWPWAPEQGPAPGLVRVTEPDAAAVAGAYYEPVERAVLFGRRATTLVALMGKEAARLSDAERKARADLAGFADPERYRRQAEALLAGGTQARREADTWVVPDPWGEPGAEVAVPADGGATLHATADRLYRRHRRACRGLEHARARARGLAERVERIDSLRQEFDDAPDAAGLAAFEAALREMGVPVGLEATSVRRRAGAAAAPARLEGVRLYTSSDGMTVLAGRTARGNDRLTFKLSAPEDFWFHARDSPGAHVVVRNEARRKRLPDATLHEAAAVAAWYSDKRSDGKVDVQWTLRKYVRRVRGGAPGAVLLKRAWNVRVTPGLPQRGRENVPGRFS